MKHYRPVVLLLVIALFVLTAGCNQAPQQPIPERDGLLIHISHGADNPHRVLMPLSLALKMSEGMDIRLFFDIDGVTLLTADAPDLTFQGFEKGSKELIAELIANEEVTLHACPMCMKAHGIAAEDLLEGVEVANPETFTGFTDGKIVTLDW